MTVVAAVSALAAAFFAWWSRRCFGAHHALTRKKAGPVGEVRPGEVAHVYGNVAVLERTLVSPKLGRECVYFATVEQVRRSGRKQGGAHWRTVRAEEEFVDFLLEDGSGRVKVEPEGAHFMLEKDFAQQEQGPSGSFLGIETSGERRRVVEIFIEPGDLVRVVGFAHGSPQRGDGTSDITLRRQGAPVFLVSDRPKGEVVLDFAWRAWSFAGVAVLMALFGVACLVADTDPGRDPAYVDPGAAPIEFKARARDRD